MAAVEILSIGEHLGETQQGRILTFVVPASDGCNLKCGFCFIRQRREIADRTLQPHHYTQFIREASARTRPYGLAIQGYEPLLPESRVYTQSILATGQSLRLSTALVTNGTHLREAVDWLVPLAPAEIVVSLDAPSAIAHDRLRGMSGAWATTVAGIERAVHVLSSRQLAVASVLMPSDNWPLDEMPQFLRRLGIERWIITPLLKVGRDTPGGPTGERATLYRSLARLQEAADNADIVLTIADELDCLQHKHASANQSEIRRFHVRTIPEGVDLIRLAPDGACSVGGGILQQVRPTTPRWHPDEEHAGDFLAWLLSSIGKREAAGRPNARHHF
jgi:sulfatase maturation enzyme AslB (radical SAM superfamily)